jgi:hypothetical protein
MPLRIGSIVIHCHQFDRMLTSGSKRWVMFRESRRAAAGASYAIPAGSIRTCRSRRAKRSGPAATGSTWICIRTTRRRRSRASRLWALAGIPGATGSVPTSSSSKILTAISSVSSNSVNTGRRRRPISNAYAAATRYDTPNRSPQGDLSASNLLAAQKTDDSRKTETRSARRRRRHRE